MLYGGTVQTDGGYEHHPEFSHAIAQSLAKVEAGTLAAQRTVILFPGGMASELARAHRTFDGTAGSYAYETVWYDVVGILLAAHTLQLDM